MTAFYLLTGVLMIEPQAPVEHRHLLEIKRIYVDKLSGAEGTSQIRDLLISAIQASKLFQITENPDRADAYLRGGAEDLIFTETFQYRDSIDGRAQVGAPRANQANRNANARGAAFSIGEDESLREQIRRHEATAAIRIVSKEGDVIWATTKESAGAKFRSASADVAAKIVEQLKQDFAAVARPSSPPTAK